MPRWKYCQIVTIARQFYLQARGLSINTNYGAHYNYIFYSCIWEPYSYEEFLKRTNNGHSVMILGPEHLPAHFKVGAVHWIVTSINQR